MQNIKEEVGFHRLSRENVMSYCVWIDALVFKCAFGLVCCESLLEPLLLRLPAWSVCVITLGWMGRERVVFH